MATNVHLTLSCGDYDINRGLIDGSVTPAGIDLTVLTSSAPERHWRMIKHREFDVCEFSLGSYLLLADQKAAVTAIPAFPHRRFRHTSIFVNTSAGITVPSDLAGKRIGLRSWQTTACFWMRGVLQDEYGIELGKVQWFTQDDEDVAFSLPEGISVEKVPDAKTVTEMLEEGEIDALIYPEVPRSIRVGDERVSRLFPNGKSVEQDYFEKTGFFPIMHTVIVKDEVLSEHPWVARSLLEALRASKEAAFRRIENPRTVVLAWLPTALREQKQIMGDDPWAYDLGRNEKQLSTLLRWAREQGMMQRFLEPADLFVPSTVNDPPFYV